MTILTREYAMTRDKYFRELLRTYARRNGVVFVGIAVLCAVIASQGNGFFAGLLGAVTVLLLAYRTYMIHRFTGDPQNRGMLLRQRAEMSGEAISIHSEDGSTGTVPLESVVRATRERDHYRVYVSKINFYYIPYAAFETESDGREFDDRLVGAGKLGELD